MKSSAFFALVLLILCVTVRAENHNQNYTLPLLDSGESRPKRIKEELNKDTYKEDNYQENVSAEFDISNEHPERYNDTEVDIIVKETFINSPNNIIPQEDTKSLLYENVQEPLNYSINEVILNNEPDEIMETAAGFVPIPIIRNRQKLRRPFITRRNFRRNPYPYRRFPFFYPYSFYYPSSLRYY